jgi:hypothetical protein
MLSPDRSPAVPGERMGPAGVGRIGAGAWFVRAGRQHHPGAASGFDQSGECVAYGVDLLAIFERRAALGSEQRSVVSAVRRRLGCCAYGAPTAGRGGRDHDGCPATRAKALNLYTGAFTRV